MKTMIIERGLTELEFFDKTRPSDLYLYIKALREIGADYIELNFNSLFRLPKPNASDNYIYRVEKRSDCVIANNLPFAYACVPLRMSYLLTKIEIPVILEVNIGKSDLSALVSVLAENVDLTKISLLRLIGDFNQLPDEINDFIIKYRQTYALPIDFCPLNNSLTALSTVISAYASNSDSVTMSFGDNDSYASLEEFVITLATMYKIIVSGNFVAGICKAAIISILFGIIKTENLKSLMKQYGFTSRVISLLDNSKENLRPNAVSKAEGQNKTIFDRLLADYDFDKETNKRIVDILKGCSINIYSPNDGSNKTLIQ